MSKYSEENISRIGNAAIYIAEHTSDLSKTKLLKLLYLMEERSALKYQQPFLALPFEVWQAGPVAKDIYIDISDGAVLLSKYIRTELVKLDDNKDAQYIHPVAKFDDEDFSAYEIRLMDEVLKEYGDKTATEYNNTDYVIDFTKAMMPCAAEYYKEALDIHNASNAYSRKNGKRLYLSGQSKRLPQEL